ncbi:hypothetical protein [Roseiconus lacunae]|uniref:hypothetical protein n=1 Tax=Roseiconus lacunae TaxID=2605694 RepID=UPI001E43C504|nr:hypothetical protein [Roseiconus lacunae]MCD0459555.1 hypothetical protein [Roseiconus lacunae]
MKNQYFGDQRDFMKYDLLMEVVETTPGVCRLTNVPMLTPNDETGEGNVTDFIEGNRRSDLYHYMRYCLARGDRNIRNLRTFFAQRHFAYYGYRDDIFYEDGNRQEYFDSIPAGALQDAVVFIDPDTGIQSGDNSYMRRAGIDRYLFWNNIVVVFNRMNANSVLIIYQHLQRNADLVVQNMQDKSTALADHLGRPSVACVDDGDIAFLIATKSDASMTHISETLPHYAQTHDLRHHLFPEVIAEKAEAQA